MVFLVDRVGMLEKNAGIGRKCSANPVTVRRAAISMSDTGLFATVESKLPHGNPPIVKR
jgi:hypothetical protein